MDKFGKRSWVFDSNRKLTSELYFEWGNETSQWIDRSETESTHNNALIYNYLLLQLQDDNWEYLLYFRHMCTGYTGWYTEDEKQNSLSKGNFYYSQQTVDIDDKNKISRMLYPNPTNDYFQISGNLLTGNTYLEFFDLAGKLIMKQQLDNQSRISVEQFAIGCYLIQLKNSGQLLQSEKLIVYYKSLYFYPRRDWLWFYLFIQTTK